MQPKAPLWRPLVTIAAICVLWVALKSPEELGSRSWTVYARVAVLCVAAAVGAWAIQRSRGRRWPWLVEMLVVSGLVIGVAILIRSVYTLILT